MARESKGEPAQLRAIQDSMVDGVKSCFSARELDALRVVIRLTVEFHRDLKADKTNNFVSESVFSGIDSFTLLLHAYKVLAGAETRSQLQWNAVSVASLKHEFQLLYQRFITEQVFEKQCRLLLDLFKVQIAVAAMTYDCCND
jgi:hypothetical protein